jgi:hypothetical protein
LVAVLAIVIVYRTHFNDDDWFDRMETPSISSWLRWPKTSPTREIIDAIDEESSTASGLVIVDDIDVREQLRRRELGHRIVQAIGRVFRSDIVALEPEGCSVGPEGTVVRDELKRRNEVCHWRDVGFMLVPDTRVMMRPMGARSAPRCCSSISLAISSTTRCATTWSAATSP